MAERSESASNAQMLEFAASIIAAYVTNNPVPASDLPNIIKSVHGTLCALTSARDNAGTSDQKPAVPIKKSISPEYIVCLEDGKKLKMLKRYLRTNFDMTPEQYRVKWGLPREYPMVAPSYSIKRSDFAKKIGLGRTKSNNTSKRRRRA